MNNFYITPNIKQLVDLAFTEDLYYGDPTTDAIFSKTKEAIAKLITKEAAVVCGIPLLHYIIDTYAKDVSIIQSVNEGDLVENNTVILEMQGSAVSLLTLERTMLNFVQHLSGIATLTRKVISRLPPHIRVTDTRKTLPGWRALQKYAVTVGGAFNHRFSLSGGIMIKDNHIDVSGGIASAIQKVRQYAPHTLKIEVEVRNEVEVEEAIKAGADILLLDNMSVSEMKKVVDKYKGQVILEASGGINLNNVAKIATTGVDVISMGMLTHSIRNIDISMKMELKK